MNTNQTLSPSKSIPKSARKSSLFGSILLICGSSIGVGILSLPILTGQAGSLPTCLIFLASCIYMTITALLILETATLCDKDANFIAISNKTLNQYGKWAIIGSFAFLFYSLTTAYLAKGGELVHSLLIQSSGFALPMWSGAVFLALLSGLLIFRGHYVVDYFNRIFMIGLFATYFYLDTAGIEYFQFRNITHVDWSYSLFIIPFIITSFGYHNLVPTISNYFNHDRKKGAIALISSGIILFFLYLVWVVGLHGIIPLEGPISFANSFANEEIVTQPLARMISSPMIQFCAQYMAIFAIITSLLGQGLSIIDFMAESFKMKKTETSRLILCAALFIPTLICSQIIPGVFFKALELAGGIAAMVIFGIIPGLMGWVIRYRKNELSKNFVPLVPGGKCMLIGVISCASLLIMYELAKNLF